MYCFLITDLKKHIDINLQIVKQNQNVDSCSIQQIHWLIYKTFETQNYPR